MQRQRSYNDCVRCASLHICRDPAAEGAADSSSVHVCSQAQAALAGAVVALAASPGEDLLLVALASARLLSLDISRLDALQVV
jgi:hypothetical protein